MRRGAGVRGIAALAAVLGVSMLLCASASARMAQTITFTSSPPTQAVAGDSYEVSARSSSGLPVQLARSAAARLKPDPDRVVHLEKVGVYSGPPPTGGRVAAPAVVYFVSAAEECSLEAEAQGDSEYEAAGASLHFGIGIDPSEQFTFISTPPSHALVDEPPYDPVVLSSAGIDVFLYSATPSVCELPLGEEEVFFLSEGTCTIAASQRRQGVAEAQQSFKVFVSPTTSEAKQTPTRAERMPTKKSTRRGARLRSAPP